MSSIHRRLLPSGACMLAALLVLPLAGVARSLGLPPEHSGIDSPKRFDLVRPETVRSTAPSQSAPRKNGLSVELVRYEIRYAAPGAEKVYLLWGLNGWQVPDKPYWPEGSTAKKQYPYCKMQRERGEFAIALTIPEGATLDYCFNALAPSEGIDVWDTNGAPGRDYHGKVVRNGVAVVIGQGIPAAPAAKSSNARLWLRPPRVILLAAAAVLAALVSRPLLRRGGSVSRHEG